MKCSYCQGTMKRGATAYHISRGICNLMLDAVPVLVCAQCGQTFFEEKQVEALQELIEILDQKTRKWT